MEVGQIAVNYITIERLNPSFNGIWSWRPNGDAIRSMGKEVLILLLMEYGHGGYKAYLCPLSP